MAASVVKVYASRDFKHYRSVTSPVADIAQRYYAFLAGASPEGSFARLAYATAFIGQEAPAGVPLAGSDIDRELRRMFSAPPHVVLAQGPMHPWGLFTSEKEEERASLRSFATTASGVALEPSNTIFLPWSVHQALHDAIDADDVDEIAAAAFFIFAGVVHETAHWIAALRHGYKHDPTRSANLTSTMPLLDFERSKIVQHSRRDWGTHAKELLLGFAFTYVSYADGSHEVVCQKVQPAIPKLRPMLTPAIQAALVGRALPQIVDISKYGVPNVREPPKWRKGSDYLIVSSISPDNACHHGACRLRPET